jgi:hypothetical protein
MTQQWLSENPVGIEDGLRHDKWSAEMRVISTQFYKAVVVRFDLGFLVV